MDSNTRIARAQLIPRSPSVRKRRGKGQGQPQEPFNLGDESVKTLPDANYQDATSKQKNFDRSVTPIEPDEAGSQIDITA